MHNHDALGWDTVMDETHIGRCPICNYPLGKDDILQKRLRGIVYTHNAYVCRFCGHIIGFSAAQP